MVITVQGYNHKNNKAVFVVSVLAAFTALGAGERTLVIQLTDPDIDCVENTLLKSRVKVKTGEMEFLNDGIDTLLRSAQVTKLSKDDFNQTCTPLLESENRLDILTVSRNEKFTDTVMSKLSEVESMIKDAKGVYQNIFLLLPAKHEAIVKAVNTYPIIDKSVYCIKQGHSTTGPVFGKHVVYVASDFENESVFSVKAMKKVVTEGKGRATVKKISHNVSANDSAMKGQLLKFIRDNRDLPETDINYIWQEDITGIMDLLLAGSVLEEKDEEILAERLPKREKRILKVPNMISPVSPKEEPRLLCVPEDTPETMEEIPAPALFIPQKQTIPEFDQPVKKKGGFFCHKKKEEEKDTQSRFVDEIVEQMVQENLAEQTVIAHVSEMMEACEEDMESYTPEDLKIQKNKKKKTRLKDTKDGYVENIKEEPLPIPETVTPPQPEKKKRLFNREKKEKPQKLPGGWKQGDTCYLINNKKRRSIGSYTVKDFDGKYFVLLDKTENESRASLYRMHHSREDALESLDKEA